MSKSIRAKARCRPAASMWARALVALGAAVGGAQAAAHGFGQRYDLPLPLWLYLFATAAAIILSFVVAALFLRRPPGSDSYPRVDILAYLPGRLIANPWLAFVLTLAVVVLFVVTIAAGFLGNQNPYQNIAPTLIWVIGWVGLAYVSAFAGDLWRVINPWRTLFSAVECCYRKLSGGRDLGFGLAFPEWLGVWPAFVLLFVFSWIELVYPSPALPLHIAWLILGYSILTWTGMFLYGRETWLEHAEVFTQVFGVFARFAPTEHGQSQGRRELALRPLAAGLLDSRPASPSMTALVLLILATVLFDGALSTPEWVELESRFAALASGYGDAAPIFLRTVGLAVSWFVFFGAFLAVCATMATVAAQGSALVIARSFALTLVPIAIAYHLAHYLTYLLVQGQYIIPLLSDPFGYGWDLFGTAGYRVDIGLVGARFAWYTAVIAIVVGHVIAVFLAHHRALRLFGTRRAALRSQVPLTALMVAYTFVSLSILAEPITERTAAEPTATASGELNVPPDALLPEAGSGTLRPVGAGHLAAQKLTYRMLGSDFHDGSKMTVADLLYAYAFAYKWGVRGETSSTHYDPLIDAETEPMRRRFTGVKVRGVDTTSKSFRVAEINVIRELFIVDVYLTGVAQDPERDAVFAPPWTTVPWHLLALMEEAVNRGWAAFSEEEAQRRGVAWLDLVRSDPLNKQLAALVDTFKAEGYRPEALRSMVSVEDARKRWAALAGFYQAHGHFLVTNGPYQLKQWSASDAVLDVFRDLSYPLGVGSYDAYAIPRRGFITRVEQDKGRVRLSGEIETIMKFQRNYEIHREPLRSVASDVLQRAAPECRYTIIDEAGRVVLAGVLRPGEDASFGLDLNGRLAAGRYTMLAELIVNDNAANADIRRTPLAISPGP